MDVIFADFKQQLQEKKRKQYVPRKSNLRSERHYDHVLMSSPNFIADTTAAEDGQLAGQNPTQQFAEHQLLQTNNEKSIRTLLNMNHQQMINTDNIFIVPADVIDTPSSAGNQ